MLREFARLQAAGLRVGEADFTEIENRLTPLMADESPWRYSARELLGLAAFKAGKTTEARTILTPLFVDQATPQSITRASADRDGGDRGRRDCQEVAERRRRRARHRRRYDARRQRPPANAPPAKKD